MKEPTPNISTTPKPNPFTKVTPLSKATALALFVALPFIGFYLGSQYQTLLNPKTAQDSNINLNQGEPKKDKQASSSATILSYAVPKDWETFGNSTLRQVGFDPKTMAANNITESGTGLRLTYGKTGELIIERFLFSQHPKYGEYDHTLWQLILYSFEGDYGKFTAEDIKNSQVKDYVIDNLPALFLFDPKSSSGRVFGAIALSSNYFVRFVSDGVPYPTLEKVLRTIKVDSDR